MWCTYWVSPPTFVHWSCLAQNNYYWTRTLALTTCCIPRFTIIFEVGVHGGSIVMWHLPFKMGWCIFTLLCLSPCIALFEFVHPACAYSDAVYFRNTFCVFLVFRFGFIPRTYVLPQDSKLLRQAWEKSCGKEKWIIKPVCSIIN